MQDVQLEYDDNGIYDISISDGLVDSVDGLHTSIIVSLFTDARASDSLVPEAQNRRGWVGNILTAIDNREIGSTLWLLDQARLTSDTVSQATIYARESQLYLTEDSIASEVNVSVGIVPRTREANINIEIIISDNVIERYNALWRSTSGTGLSNI